MKLPLYSALSAIALLLVFLSLPLAAALPADVLQDKYRLMIKQNLQKREYAKALVNFDKLQAAGGELTPELMFQQGLALSRRGRLAEAEQVLTRYLEQTGKQGPHYQEALAMLISAESANEQRAEARSYDLAPFRDDLENGLKGPEMVFVKPGCFYLKQPKVISSETGASRKRVCLEAYAVSTHEITFDDFQLFAAATGRDIPSDEGWGRSKRPVINVPYADAEAYAVWLAGETGKAYRLPTEAEWEYAARAGTDTSYWWGDDVETGHANCDGCASQWDNRQTAPVGSFPPNEWGLFDTAGNVGEWSCSEMTERYDGNELECSGAFRADSRRVVRGGSWYLGPNQARAETRGWAIPQALHNDVGFRVVLLP